MRRDRAAGLALRTETFAMPRVRIAGLVLLLTAGLGRSSSAQIQPPIAKPVFHGILQLVPATGRMDRKTGTGTLVINRWTFIPNPDSNGVHPEQEPVLVALGDDAFLSVAVTSPSFVSRRVSLPRTCIDPSASWPWLGR